LAAAELAGVRNYAVVNLADHFHIETVQPPPELQSAVKAMIEAAPPDALFLLDSRISLSNLTERSEVERHLLKLRALAPGALQPNQYSSSSDVRNNLFLPAPEGGRP
jgi:hypothetical protein